MTFLDVLAVLFLIVAHLRIAFITEVCGADLI